MRQVSTQEELRAALNAREEEIQVTADFQINAQQNITYPLLLHSASADAVHMLSKTAGFAGSLLRVSGGGQLTLENLILDGSAAGSYQDNIANRTLVQVEGGSVHLTTGSALQNNSSYQEGGGLYLSGGAAYVNSLLMDGNAVIRGCNSRTSGGGLMAALRSNGDNVRLEGNAVIEANTAANGGGAYLRSYLAEAGGSLSIGDQVKIRSNQATTNGGGLYCSSYSSGAGASLSLTVEGETEIFSNQAASGGGLYFYSANPGDRLNLAGSVQIRQNIVTGVGGGVAVNAPRDAVSLSIQGASITGNRAGNGGGFYLRATAGGSLALSGQAVLSGNEASGAASSAGGGLWIQNLSGTLEASFSDTEIRSNQASGNGGGLFFSNSGRIEMQLSGGTISGNTAGASGGGGFFTGSAGAAGTLAMDGVTVSDNIAGTMGGGLCLGVGTGTLASTFDSCTISGNTATANSGGGIWSGDTLFIRGGTILTKNSSTAGNGGGIYLNSEAGALILSGDAKITENRADNQDNSFGGHGGGICAVPGRVELQDQAEVSHNSAGKFGGGISAAEGSTVVMASGSIHSNQAGQQGGGLWNHTGQFTQTGGTIENNSAPTGGGLYNDADSTARILGGSILGNTATQAAPGIYNGGSLYTQGQRELTNGLYIENRQGAARISGALEAGTAIRLEHSGYVTPNLEGTPIVVGEATPQYPLLSQTDADGFQKPLSGFDGWEIRLSEDSTQVLLAPEVYGIVYENTKGAQNPNPDSYTVVTPTIVLLPLADREGERFTGWFDAPEGGAQIGEIPSGSTGNLTLYAQWRSLLHTLTYYGNDTGGSFAQNIPGPVSVLEGQSVVLSNQVPTREGFAFSGWNTDPSGAGRDYKPGDSIPLMEADLELYAQWSPLPPDPRYLALAYCANDAGGPPAWCMPCSGWMPYGKSARVSCCIPRRAGFQFTGWNTSPSGTGQQYLPGQGIGPIREPICLYAQWSAVQVPGWC